MRDYDLQRSLKFEQLAQNDGIEYDVGPYIMRGEESQQARACKWQTNADKECVTPQEWDVIRDWLDKRYAEAEPTEFHPVHPFSTGMPSDTSSGMPWKLLGFKDKASVCSSYGVDMLTKFGEEAIVSDNYFQYEFLKQEPIKKEKDVRTIITYPVHVHLALAKWLLPFSLYTKSFKQCAIGWSKYYNGVGSLVEALRQEDAQYFEVDAKRWDSTIPKQIVKLVLDLYFSKFPRGCITKEMQAAVIRSITDGWVVSSNGETYYRTNGNSSGNPITSELNTMVHLVVWLLAYYRTFKELNTFDATFKLRLYGDDVIGSTVSMTIEQFKEAVKDLPVVYPEEDWKVQDTPVGLTFLGNKIHVTFNRYTWLPAKPQKMWASLKWVEKKEHDNYERLFEQLISLTQEYQWDGVHHPPLLRLLEVVRTKIRVDHEQHDYKWSFDLRNHLTFGTPLGIPL